MNRRNQHQKWAVCPGIGDSSKAPRLYDTKYGADRFLRSEAVFPARTEARLTGRSLTEIMRTRKERVTRRRKAEAEIKRGKLHPLSVPADLLPITNRNQGWLGPVPVRSLSAYVGPTFTRGIQEFIPAEPIPVSPSLDEEMSEVLHQCAPNFCCLLDTDWQFEQIEADADKRSGHRYSREMHASIPGIVARAALDVQRSLRRFHQSLPCSAVADFWRSWQVHHHIATFCDHLADSEVARLIAGDAITARRLACDARDYVLMKFATCADEFLGDLPAQSNALHTATIDRLASYEQGARAQASETAGELSKPSATQV